MGAVISMSKVFTEMSLITLEITADTVLGNHLLKAEPVNDDKKIVVFHPGFMAPQGSLFPLMHKARESNHAAYGWVGEKRLKFGFNLNYGPATIPLEDVAKHIAEVSDLHGGKPVTLVGHSLGGAYIMAAAAKLQEQDMDIVGRIITLGSPSTTRVLDLEHMQVDRTVKNIFSNLNPSDSPNMIEFIKYAQIAEDGALDSIPTTHFYSRKDFIVEKEVASHPERENIEVVSSHSGMPFHPVVQYAVRERIEQPYGEFEHFDREDNKHPKWVRAMLPRNPWHEESYSVETVAPAV